jgi:hypothetical protein
MWKFVTGAKEPPAKKYKKDCQKEYKLHRKPQSFRNEWAVGLILISTFTSGNRPTKNQNYPYRITGSEKLVYVPGNGQIAYFCTF